MSTPDDLLAVAALHRCMAAQLGHRLVEIISVSEIAADHPGISSLCMGPRQDPAARLAVNRQHLGVIGLHQRAELHVAQLAHIELRFSGPVTQPRNRSEAGCISRCPSTTRCPWWE